jgi:hypothetical protein
MIDYRLEAKEHPMPDGSSIPLFDHELSVTELEWVRGVYDDFRTAKAAFAGRESGFNAREALREVLGRPKHALAAPMDLSGDGVWRNGRNSDGRLVACVFLKTVELHKHARSRTDQFPMYVVGEADAFSMAGGQPVLTPVTGGDHFHNSPGAPHAFLPKVGEPAAKDWEIAFIAITPRNLREDTQEVSEGIRAAYKRVAGVEAPAAL